MKSFILYPTYVIAQLMHPILPQDHKWKNDLPDFNKRVKNSTTLNHQFVALFTITILQLIVLGFIISL